MAGVVWSVLCTVGAKRHAASHGGPPSRLLLPHSMGSKGRTAVTHPPIGAALRTSGLAWSLPAKARLPTPPPLAAPPISLFVKSIINLTVDVGLAAVPSCRFALRCASVNRPFGGRGGRLRLSACRPHARRGQSALRRRSQKTKRRGASRPHL